MLEFELPSQPDLAGESSEMRRRRRPLLLGEHARTAKSRPIALRQVASATGDTTVQGISVVFFFSDFN